MQVTCGTRLLLSFPFSPSRALPSPKFLRRFRSSSLIYLRLLLVFDLSFLNCTHSSRRSGYIQLSRRGYRLVCNGSSYHRFAPAHMGRPYKETRSIPSPLLYFSISHIDEIVRFARTRRLSISSRSPPSSSSMQRSAATRLSLQTRERPM